MKYFGIVLRILIILSGVHMMILSWFERESALMCSWVSVTLIGIYLALQAVMWPKSMLCPFTEKCREKMWCKK